MLEFREVTKRFDTTTAVDRVSLHVATGEVVALIGPSGCGKSTLLRMIVGLVQPDEGAVQFRETDLGEQDLIDVRRQMGYVIQEGGLFPHLTARGNVALLAGHLDWQPDRIEQRLAELLELTHLSPDVLDRFPNELSGGQRQRISLMRALMLDPDVMLLDEPLGALDPLIRTSLQADLREIFQTLHKTAVLVSHDLAEADYLADRIVLLRDGRIVQEGTLDDLVRRPATPFVEQFVQAQHVDGTLK